MPEPAPEPVAEPGTGLYGAESGQDEASWWFAPGPGELSADPVPGGGQPPPLPQQPSQPRPGPQPQAGPPQPDPYGRPAHGRPAAPSPGTYDRASAPYGDALHAGPAPDAASAPPSAPAGPVAPSGPAGPAGPIAPAKHSGPVAPAGHAGTVGPAAPGGPGARAASEWGGQSVPSRAEVPVDRRAEAREDGPSTLGLRAPRRESGGPPRTERPPGPSRLEARRAARALKPGPGIIASRAIGEAFITCGVLMMLFVVYQVWWSNVRADQQAGGATDRLHEQWDKHEPGKGVDDPERKPGAFEPGEGFAVIHIPRIDVTAPIAQGVSKTKVLDKGMVGHYATEPLKTAMPWERKGNFALAGHRNTHGEPFRYINRLEPGDAVVVETQSKYYTYKVTRQLPSTSPSDTGVIDPVPPKSGFQEPGRYVTLTTCTPEFTSKYRLIVWGKMVDERPRGKGKPDALVD
ncbi:class E sortase [Streptomyces reniochalinae]|uniref:class E sortase n=1 Tax=Streptomyces reniochalinae TaxID=2250578 RepID=UPI003CCC685B